MVGAIDGDARATVAGLADGEAAGVAWFTKQPVVDAATEASSTIVSNGPPRRRSRMSILTER